jgi:hypothetical protein
MIKAGSVLLLLLRAAVSGAALLLLLRWRRTSRRAVGLARVVAVVVAVGVKDDWRAGWQAWLRRPLLRAT